MFYLVDENSAEYEVVFACEFVLNVLANDVTVLVEGEEGKKAKEVVLALCKL